MPAPAPAPPPAAPFPSGIHVPLITPFTSDDHIATEALEALAHHVLDAGAAGLLALGTTAEPAALDPEERRVVLDTCARVARERGAYLTVGTGGSSTRGTAGMLRELAADCPEAAAALLPVPPFTRPTEDGVVAHFTHLAAESPLPLVIYNIPYRTGRSLTSDTLRRIAGLPAVIAVKHAVGALDADTVDLLADPPPDFAVHTGDDLYTAPMLALGAPGAILASAHLATARQVEHLRAWQSGDTARARELGHALARLSAELFREPNPGVIKQVLHRQGLIPTPDVRLPLLPAGSAPAEAALRRLAEAPLG
jgi:4-hydroxy-tetrahydrodipicolinate synthase